MDTSTVIPGPCYVIKVKPVKGDWPADDLLYGVVVKGESKFGFMDFQRLCEDANKRFYISFKVKEGKRCTWKDCLEMMEDRPPKGEPWLMSDRLYSFSEAAAVAYQKGFFTDQKGLATLGRLTAPSPSLKLVKLVTGSQEQAPSTQYMMEMANQSSEALRNIQRSQDLPSALSSHGVSQLVADNRSIFDMVTEQDAVPKVASNVTVEGVESGDVVNDEGAGLSDGNRKEGVGKMFYTMVEQMELESLKEVASVTAAKLEAADLEKDALLRQVSVLQGKLKTSEEQGAKFMAELDKHKRSLHLVNDDIAAAIVEKIGPKFAPLGSLAGVAKKTLEHVEALAARSGDTDLKEFRVRVDSCFDSVCDGVSTIKDILGAHGLSEGEDEVNLPEAVKYMFEMTRYGAQSIGTPTRDEPVQRNVCYYVINGSPAEMTCRCGCGYTEVRESFVDDADEDKEGDGEGVVDLTGMGGDESVMGGPSGFASRKAELMDFSVPPPVVVGNQLVTPYSSGQPSHVLERDPRKIKNKSIVRQDDKRRKSGTVKKTLGSEQTSRGKVSGGRRLDFPSPVPSSSSGSRGYRPPFLPQQRQFMPGPGGGTTHRGGVEVWEIGSGQGHV